MRDRSDLVRAFSLIIAAYLLAVAAAAVTVRLLHAAPLWQACIADLVATGVVFLFSRSFKNSSFYDPYWSLAPLFLLGYWWWVHAADANLRLLFVACLVCAWSIRLTWNWARGWRGLQHADWRYVLLRKRLGRFYWPVSLLGVHLMPTAVVFAGCLPLFLLTSSPAPAWSGWDLLAAVIGVVSVGLEARADHALRAFRASRASASEVLRTGVWAWCRHPNYLGEIGFWWALALFGMSAGQPYYMAGVGAAAMVVLFLVVSIPMIERKLLRDKPGYADYRRQVPMLLPWRIRPGSAP